MHIISYKAYVNKALVRPVGTVSAGRSGLCRPQSGVRRGIWCIKGSHDGAAAGTACQGRCLQCMLGVSQAWRSADVEECACHGASRAQIDRKALKM